MVDQTKLTLSDESGQEMKHPNKLLKHLEESEMKSLPRPKTGFVVTHFLTVSNIERSTHFYRDILGGEVVLAGEPTFIALGNTYIALNVGGGPTDDKPNVILRPPTSSTEVSSFLNFRVSDIQHFYQEWKGKGAEFLTEKVTAVDFSERPFKLSVRDQHFTADAVIVSTGAQSLMLGLEAESRLLG